MKIGGGYVFPAAPEMFEFMFQIVDALKATGKDVAVLFLSYGTSIHRYPSYQTNKSRSRTRRNLPPTTPTSIRPPQPRPHKTRNLTKEHHPHRRLCRRKPSPFSPLPHLPSTPLNHRPNSTSLPLRTFPRCRPNLTLGRLLYRQALFQRKRLQRLHRSTSR